MVLRAQQQGRQQAEDAQRRAKEILRTTRPTSNQWPNAPKSCDEANLGSSSSEDKNDLASRIAKWQVLADSGMGSILEYGVEPETGHQLGRQATGSRPTESRQKLARASSPNPGGLGFKRPFCLFPSTNGKVKNSDRKSPWRLYH